MGKTLMFISRATGIENSCSLTTSIYFMSFAPCVFDNHIRWMAEPTSPTTHLDTTSDSSYYGIKVLNLILIIVYSRTNAKPENCCHCSYFACNFVEGRLLHTKNVLKTRHCLLLTKITYLTLLSAIWLYLGSIKDVLTSSFFYAGFYRVNCMACKSR